jgi:hypothetical protein
MQEAEGTFHVSPTKQETIFLKLFLEVLHHSALTVLRWLGQGPRRHDCYDLSSTLHSGLLKLYMCTVCMLDTAQMVEHLGIYGHIIQNSDKFKIVQAIVL